MSFSEVIKATAEVSKAVSEIGSLAGQIKSEFPDLFGKVSNTEGLKGIEGPFDVKAEHPAMFDKVENDIVKHDDYGKAYRIDDELLPNNDYSINGYKYSTDELGRKSSVEGELHLKTHEGRMFIKDSLETIGKGYQELGDDRGHIIGDQFGGSNGLENMIPQKADVNRVAFKNFENQLANEVKAGNSVHVKIDLVYDGASHRPSDIAVQYDINGKQNVRFFSNT